MTLSELDFMFPFIVFFYGFVMTILLNSNFFVQIAQEKLSAEMYVQYSSHKHLGFVCLVVGGLWSLQNLWLR